MKKLYIATLLILLLLPVSVDAKRKRHRPQRRQHTTITQPEPVLSDCAKFRLAHPGVLQKLTPEQEERIKLGIDSRRPQNVDPCP